MGCVEFLAGNGFCFFLYTGGIKQHGSWVRE